jgi:surface antigen
VSVVALSACSTPKRGESELEYKNRLAKYTIAGVLIGGYYGAYHANVKGALPIGKIIDFNDPERTRLYLSLFYAALGGAIGHTLVENEGDFKRLLYSMQKALSYSTLQALEASEIDKDHAWTSPDQKAYGAIRVVERYRGSRGYACQDLTVTINTSDDDDVSETAQQTACQLPSGHWELWTRG